MYKLSTMVLLFGLNLQCILSQSITISGPAGSGEFGSKVKVLTNGNYVVVDPSFDNGSVNNVGAVYLYNGLNHNLISILTGSHAEDRIGLNGVVALTNGNFVIVSSFWDNGNKSDAGAVTWGNGTTGVSGVVSISNSLIGSSSGDRVGIVLSLPNGNYVVESDNWDNAGIINAGAVTWGNGSVGISGEINSTNSLVGSKVNDRVGYGGIASLTNSNYVVASPEWDNGSIVNAGAATWGSGSSGITGLINSSNSLVGSSANDKIADEPILTLTNGNYVVQSRYWDNGSTPDVGAITWGNGNSGITGTISSSNSLIGSTAGDGTGFSRVIALSNGNYVVGNPLWDLNSSLQNVGAVTWCNGSTGRSGQISASNSLIGSDFDHLVGSGLTALTNGNYVVISSDWSTGSKVSIGAVTWGNGTTGTTGTVTSSNSLIGANDNDQIGYTGVLPLSNGNYLVSSMFYDNGSILDAGAVTWCNGSTPTSATVNASNSLVGSTSNDFVADMTALTNGNYLVRVPDWDNGSKFNVGAVTFGNGNTGIVGTINENNSLIGTSNSDLIGGGGVIPLENGNYVITSPEFDNGTITNVGAVTWGNGNVGTTGKISSNNSLIGSKSQDRLGLASALSNGDYFVNSTLYDNGSIVNGGAITNSKNGFPITGSINVCNSIVGNVANPSVTMNCQEDTIYKYLLVGVPSENKVVVRKSSFITSTFTDSICANQSYFWNNVNQNSPGSYLDTLQTANGCDSIVTLNLIVKSKPSKSTTTNGNTLSSSQTGAQYSWVDCESLEIIPGETSKSFTPKITGSYKVIVTLNGCSDTSNCISKTIGKISDNLQANSIIIYPNPSNDHFTVVSAKDGLFKIYNELGQLIREFQLNTKTQSTCTISNLEPGVYFIMNSSLPELTKQKIIVF